MTKSRSASAPRPPGRCWATLEVLHLGPQRCSWTDRARAGRARLRRHSGDRERGEGQCARRGGHDPFLHGHRPILPRRPPSVGPALGSGAGPAPAFLDLASPGRGLVVLGVQHDVGGVLLLGDAHAARRGCTGTSRRGRGRFAPGSGRRAGARDGADLPGPDVRGGGPDRGGHGVRLRRHGERDRGLREGQPTLGHPDQLHGLRGRDGGRQRGRVREPMSSLARMISRRAMKRGSSPPRQAQVVQGRVGVGARTDLMNALVMS